MNQSRCVVTFTDSDRIVHEVEVWASTVYEAVGEAMREFRAGGITRDLPGLNTELSIAVHRQPVTHKLQLRQVTQWAAGGGKVRKISSSEGGYSTCLEPTTRLDADIPLALRLERFSWPFPPPLRCGSPNAFSTPREADLRLRQLSRQPVASRDRCSGRCSPWDWLRASPSRLTRRDAAGRAAVAPSLPGPVFTRRAAYPSRSTSEPASDRASEFSDGVLTKVGFFQKLYTQNEFREYLSVALGRRPHMASLGIAYVFRDDEAEANYLAQLALYRPLSFRESVRAEFAKDRTAQKYMALATTVGRTPLETEFKYFPRLIERYGSVSRIERIAKSLLDSDMLASAQEERRINILMYIAMLRLQGLTPPPIRSLSDEVQADVKMLWRSYKAAIQAGTTFLFELGKPGQIADECKRSRIGKKLPDSLYVHKSAESQLSALLQLMVLTARQIVGEVRYDLIKISTDGKKLSFLAYRDFDDAPHPELAYSLKVFLPKASYELRSYVDSLNPPILHRKETFLDPLHPRYAQYAQLTKQEEALDLLSRTDIGTRNGWQTLLASRSLRVENNAVVSTTT